MSHFPAIEHHGVCASVSTERVPTGRWKAWVHPERGVDYARLRGHDDVAQRVPNDFPSEESAVLGAYAYVRTRIDQGMFNK